MRTEVRISFNGSTIPGGPEGVLGPASCGPDVARWEYIPAAKLVDVWVTLGESDPRLPQLRQLLKRQGVSWLEWHEDRHSEEELDSARLLVLEPGNDTSVDGGVEWGTTFDLTGACPACATGCRQTSALFINGEEVPKLEGHRAATTYFWHILVDDGLASDLESTGATGLSFRSVYAVMRDKRQVKLRWRQLCADNTLPRMSRLTTGLSRNEPCEVCYRNGYIITRDEPGRPVYRSSDLRGALDVNQTWENMWFARIKPDFSQSILSRPWTIVTPKVRRVFRDAGVTEFDWLPVRADDSAP